MNRTPSLSAASGFKPDRRPFRGTLHKWWRIRESNSFKIGANDSRVSTHHPPSKNDKFGTSSRNRTYIRSFGGFCVAMTWAYIVGSPGTIRTYIISINSRSAYQLDRQGNVWCCNVESNHLASLRGKWAAITPKAACLANKLRFSV